MLEKKHQRKYDQKPLNHALSVELGKASPLKRPVISNQTMKEFLDKNKIFFETLGALGTSLIAVIISIVAIVISIQSRDITKQQVEISKRLNRPLITANMEPTFDDSLNVIGSSVKIINQGELIREPTIKVFEYLDLDCGLVGKGVWKQTVPIDDYYIYTYLTGYPTGVIARLIPEENFHKMGRLYKECLKISNQKEGSAYPIFKSLVILQYETSYGESITDYFLATPHGNCSKVNEVTAQKLISLTKSKGDPDFDLPRFSKIKAEQIRACCGLSQ